MTAQEKAIIESTNRDMIKAAKQFVSFFHVALTMAAAHHDRRMLEQLEQAAIHYRDHLGKYIDLCGDAAIDTEVLVLHDYFVENAADIRAALKAGV